jgi:hypothetical protein
MKNILRALVALSLLAAAPAFAADGWISLSYQKSVDPVPRVNKQIIPDADMAAVAEWAANKYLPAGVIENGVVRPPTADEVFLALTQDIYKDIKRQVDEYRRNKAAAAAAETVPPISLTPAP